MMQTSVQLGTYPINLVLVSNGMIGFSPAAQFPVIVDYLQSGTMVIADMGGIIIGDKSYEYGKGYTYKDDDNLLEWLKSFNLMMPQFNNPFGF
jgi:hypothetical protein